MRFVRYTRPASRGRFGAVSLYDRQKQPTCFNVGHGCFHSDVLPSFGGSTAGSFSSGNKEAHIEPSMSWQ